MLSAAVVIGAIRVNIDKMFKAQGHLRTNLSMRRHSETHKTINFFITETTIYIKWKYVSKKMDICKGGEGKFW